MSAITKEAVLKMGWKEIQAAIKNPATSSDMQSLLRDRQVVARVSELMLEAKQKEEELDAQLSRVIPPSTEELAAQAEQLAAEVPTDAVPAPVAEPVAVAPPSYEADDAALKAVGVTVVRDSSGNPTRYIEEYQVLGEDGKPIGRPTHLESRSWPEHIAKQREVHTQATRAFHRLKQQKLSFKNEPKTLLTPEQIGEAARVALEAKDTAKVTDVIRATIESEYQKREMEIANQKAFEDGRAIAHAFLRNHLHDYNDCDANKAALQEYFVTHDLEFTLDNMEAAFQDLQEQGDKLVPVKPVATRTATVAANPAAAAAVAAPTTPAIPAVEPPAAVPVPAAPQPTAPSQPVAETTVTTPAAAPNAQPAARRPGVNGSLPPGTLSAQRPGAPDPTLARKEFLKMVRDMDPKVMRNKIKTDPQFVKDLRSHGIKV